MSHKPGVTEVDHKSMLIALARWKGEARRLNSTRMGGREPRRSCRDGRGEGRRRLRFWRRHRRKGAAGACFGRRQSCRGDIPGRHRSTAVSPSWNCPLARKPSPRLHGSRKPVAAIRSCGSSGLIPKREDGGCPRAWHDSSSSSETEVGNNGGCWVGEPFSSFVLDLLRFLFGSPAQQPPLFPSATSEDDNENEEEDEGRSWCFP